MSLRVTLVALILLYFSSGLGRDELYSLVCSRPGLTVPDMVSVFGLGPETVTDTLAQLMLDGLIYEQQGKYIPL